MSATWSGRAWSCTVRLVVEDDSVLEPAVADLTALLARVDAVASRFRPDSVLATVNARAGREVAVPPLLADLVAAALDAAALTRGAVDPTVGLAMQRIGYDRDFDALLCGVPAPIDTAATPHPPARWRQVVLRREAGLLTVPDGTALDLGATAKAVTADRAARTIATRYGTAVLVELGGDIAVAGTRPGGWAVRVAEYEGGDGQVVCVGRGGLTTSTTTVRRWRQGDIGRHHILDPSTGQPVDGPWRTASVYAPSALLANTASTAAIVLGDAAEPWLRKHGLAARLVSRRGKVTVTPGWPQPAHRSRRHGTGSGPASLHRPSHSISVGA